MDRGSCVQNPREKFNYRNQYVSREATHAKNPMSCG